MFWDLCGWEGHTNELYKQHSLLCISADQGVVGEHEASMGTEKQAVAHIRHWRRFSGPPTKSTHTNKRKMTIWREACIYTSSHKGYKCKPHITIVFCLHLLPDIYVNLFFLHSFYRDYQVPECMQWKKNSCPIYFHSWNKHTWWIFSIHPQKTEGRCKAHLCPGETWQRGFIHLNQSTVCHFHIVLFTFSHYYYWQFAAWPCSYLRPLGECWPVLLIEEVEQLVLLVQSHHLTDSLVVLFFLL